MTPRFLDESLPLTCQVNGDQEYGGAGRCAHNPAVMALLTDLRGQLPGAFRKSATCWDGSYLLNADDLSFLNTLLGEAKSRCAFGASGRGEASHEETIFATTCGGYAICITDVR